MLTAMPFLIKRQERIQSLLSGSDARWIKKHLDAKLSCRHASLDAWTDQKAESSLNAPRAD
jgi:hypothetical protein